MLKSIITEGWKAYGKGKRVSQTSTRSQYDSFPPCVEAMLIVHVPCNKNFLLLKIPPAFDFYENNDNLHKLCFH